jgi:hypothetical protein
MRGEISQKEAADSAAFQDNVFLHSVAAHIPGMYTDLYGDEAEEEYQVDEWEVPQSEDELRQFAEELASVGVPLDFSGVLLDNSKGPGK